MILHTVNKTAALAKCLPMLGEDDVLLLIEDGVLLGLENLQLDTRVLALSADVSARGLQTRLPDTISRIDYADFVDLAVRADKVCAWF